MAEEKKKNFTNPKFALRKRGNIFKKKKIRIGNNFSNKIIFSKNSYEIYCISLIMGY